MFLIKVQFTPKQAMKAQRGSGEWWYTSTLSFHGVTWRWVVNNTTRPLYLRERYPVPILYEAGWALGLITSDY
jgi:hypothetical protein